MNKKTWQDDWTAQVYGRLHALGISSKDFAKLCGFSESYLSRILRKKKSSETSKRTILALLDRLEDESKGDD